MAATPPAFSYIDSDGGTATSVTGNDKSQQINEYAANSIAQQAQSEDIQASQLPGAERDGEMNWLGSSFSGVDIKVVAHMYGDIGADTEEQSLSEEYSYQSALNTAAAKAVNAIPGMPRLALFGGAPSETFLAAAGVDFSDPLHVRVANAINVAFQVTPRSSSIDIYKGALISKMSSVALTAKLLADQLKTKLENRRSIREKSSTTITLATLQTLSLQTFREKEAVRALGNSYVKGYSRGPRTIAGSMIFTMFNEHALAKLIRAMASSSSLYGGRDAELSSLILDQLPPIDLTIVIANEYGQLSQQGIYGVEFVTDGQTMSVEDILTEEVVQFVARDCDVLTSKGNIRLSRAMRGMHFGDDGARDTSASSLLFSSRESYGKFLDKLKVRRRLLNR